jgi:hypothetical protein
MGIAGIMGDVIVTPLTEAEIRDNTCDACGTSVRAAFLAALPSGGILTVCGHHAVSMGFATQLEISEALVIAELLRSQP